MPHNSGGPSAPTPGGWRRFIFGAPRDLKDRGVFHHISLVAFLAWVGLGADGLSSSAYGPEETFKTLGEHTGLAVFLALATAGTVLVLSLSYSRIIEHFPAGGGGYVVASKLLGPSAGLISGSALLVDYVLTITVSVAAAGDALFSLIPSSIPAADLEALSWWRQFAFAHGWKLPCEVAAIVFLTLINLRGVKESVLALTPVFVIFLISHIILIGGAVIRHAGDIASTATGVADSLSTSRSSLGLLGMAALFVRAYSMGGGTYTGIEAVSNGLAIMREPRVATAKRTMVYLAVSLAVTSAGLLFCYLLFQVKPEEGKTLNAKLTESFVQGWGGWGTAFLFIVLFAEGALLIVAAQAGFIDGPRVMANMAVDSWLPHRFTTLSERLTIHNGILLMGSAALAALLYTGGDVDHLVVMYSINVFLTFSLSQAAMIRFWHGQRALRKDWLRRSAIFWVALLLCATVLVITVFEKFLEGGWITLVCTGTLITLCVVVKRHYASTAAAFTKLDAQLAQIPELIPPNAASKLIDASKPTAVLLVGSYSGLGIHTLLSVMRFMPEHFHNIVFVSVGVLDSGNFKGAGEVDAQRKHLEEFLAKYCDLARRLGLAADFRCELGTDAVDESEKLCVALGHEFPRCVFFAGKLLFRNEGPFQRLLHNQTADAIQRRLQWAGLPTVVLPARVEA